MDGWLLSIYAFVAQQVEHFNGNEKVSSSILLESSIKYASHGVEWVRIPPLALSVVNEHEVLQKCYTSERHELGSIILCAYSSAGRAFDF